MSAPRRPSRAPPPAPQSPMLAPSPRTAEPGSATPILRLGTPRGASPAAQPVAPGAALFAVVWASSDDDGGDIDSSRFFTPPAAEELDSPLASIPTQSGTGSNASLPLSRPGAGPPRLPPRAPVAPGAADLSTSNSVIRVARRGSGTFQPGGVTPSRGTSPRPGGRTPARPPATRRRPLAIASNLLSANCLPVLPAVGDFDKFATEFGTAFSPLSKVMETKCGPDGVTLRPGFSVAAIFRFLFEDTQIFEQYRARRKESVGVTGSWRPCTGFVPARYNRLSLSSSDEQPAGAVYRVASWKTPIKVMKTSDYPFEDYQRVALCSVGDTPTLILHTSGQASGVPCSDTFRAETLTVWQEGKTRVDGREVPQVTAQSYVHIQFIKSSWMQSKISSESIKQNGEALRLFHGFVADYLDQADPADDVVEDEDDSVGLASPAAWAAGSASPNDGVAGSVASLDASTSQSRIPVSPLVAPSPAPRRRTAVRRMAPPRVPKFVPRTVGEVSVFDVSMLNEADRRECAAGRTGSRASTPMRRASATPVATTPMRTPNGSLPVATGGQAQCRRPFAIDRTMLSANCLPVLSSIREFDQFSTDNGSSFSPVAKLLEKTSGPTAVTLRPGFTVAAVFRFLFEDSQIFNTHRSRRKESEFTAGDWRPCTGFAAAKHHRFAQLSLEGATVGAVYRVASWKTPIKVMKTSDYPYTEHQRVAYVMVGDTPTLIYHTSGQASGVPCSDTFRAETLTVWQEGKTRVDGREVPQVTAQSYAFVNFIKSSWMQSKITTESEKQNGDAFHKLHKLIAEYLEQADPEDDLVDDCSECGTTEMPTPITEADARSPSVSSRRSSVAPSPSRVRHSSGGTTCCVTAATPLDGSGRPAAPRGPALAPSRKAVRGIRRRVPLLPPKVPRFMPNPDTDEPSPFDASVFYTARAGGEDEFDAADAAPPLPPPTPPLVPTRARRLSQSDSLTSEHSQTRLPGVRQLPGAPGATPFGEQQPSTAVGKELRGWHRRQPAAAPQGTPGGRPSLNGSLTHTPSETLGAARAPSPGVPPSPLIVPRGLQRGTPLAQGGGSFRGIVPPLAPAARVMPLVPLAPLAAPTPLVPLAPYVSSTPSSRSSSVPTHRPPPLAPADGRVGCGAVRPGSQTVQKQPVQRI